MLGSLGVVLRETFSFWQFKVSFNRSLYWAATVGE